MRKRLPPGWQLYSRIEFEESWLPRRVKPDAVLKLKDSEGRSALVIVKANKRPLQARDALVQATSIRRLVLPQLQAAMDQAETEKETSFSLMVVSPFLGPSARDRLKDEENSFADLTGNLRLATDLLTGPGRNPAEAESLIEWMRGNLEKWQIQEFH